MKPLVILLTNVLAHPEVSERLEFYNQKRVEVAVCTMRGNLSAEEQLSECISTMMALPVSRFLLGADEAGGYAYLLSKSDGGFPTLRKLHSTSISGVNSPDDGLWEDVDVEGFCKPQSGMVDVLEKEAQPAHTLLVCDSPLDEETADNVSSFYSGELYRQSTQEWLKESNPEPWKQAPATAPSTSRSCRRFELVDRAQNSSKFWEIELDSSRSSFRTRYGRIGTNGQTSSKTLPNPAAAQNAYYNIIQQKLRKGYVEV